MRWVGIMAVLCAMGAGCRDETPAPVVDLLGASAWLMSDEGSIVPQFTTEDAPRLRFREAPPAGWTLHLRMGETLHDVPVQADPPYWRARPPASAPGWGRFELHVDGAISRIWHLHWGKAPHLKPIEAAVAQARKAEKPVEAWLEVAAVAEDAMVPSEQSRALRAAAYYSMWDYDLTRAQALLDQSTLIDRPLRNHRGLLRAKAYQAYTEEMMGRFRAATRKLRAVIEAGDRFGEQRIRWTAMQALAGLYSRMGRHELALKTQRQAMALPAKGARQNTEALTNLSWVLMNAAFQGRSTEGVGAAVDEALTAARGLGDTPLLLNAIANRAAWAWHQDQRGRVEALIAEAKALEPIEAAPRARLYLLRFEAELALARGELDRAAAAFEMGRNALDEDAVWRAHHGLARVAAKRGDDARTEAELKASVAAIRAAARRVDLTQARGTFVADRRQAVADLVAALVGRGRLAEAFAVDEADRSAMLRALDFQESVERLPPSKRQAFVTALDGWRRARGAEEDAMARAWSVPAAEQAQWRGARQRARAELARRFDATQALVELGTPPPADAAAIQARLEPDQALWAPLGERGFWMTRGGLTVVAKPLPNPGHVFVVGDQPVPGLIGSVSYLPFASLLLRAAVVSGPPLFVVDPTEDLPRARAEGRSLAKQTKGARVLVGQQATRAALLDAPSSALLHFAGHGVLTPDDPWTAHLRLHGDARLTLTDVLTLGSRFGVVVLNGCETGRAQSVGGRHTVGLPAAFLAAGARAVVATRRVVPDGAAAGFIARFYRHGGAQRPGPALAAAVAESKAKGEKIWDAFYLAGRP